MAERLRVPAICSRNPSRHRATVRSRGEKCEQEQRGGTAASEALRGAEESGLPPQAELGF